MTTILTAILTGVVVLLAGNLPWAALGAWNLRIGTAVPWAILPMVLYLWAYWRFISGGWSAPLDAARCRATGCREASSSCGFPKGAGIVEDRGSHIYKTCVIA
jgi:hypothetical protein